MGYGGAWQQSVFPLIIIDASGTFTGLFVYSPVPGHGNLIASITAAAGTDPYGNPYLAGITSYTAGGGLFAELLTGFLGLGSNAAGTTILQSGAVRTTDALAAGTTPSVIILSPTSSVFAGVSSIHLLGESQDGTGQPQILMGAAFAIAATTAAVVEVHGDVAIATAGNGLQVKGGANARIGSATLAAGTVTVANTSVTASTQVYVNHHSIGPNAGVLGYTTIPGTSFTINSTNGADANSVVWLLVEAL
jgi:hypothetical protein